MSTRDVFIRQARPQAATAAPAAPVWGADLFARQQLDAEVKRGREAVTQLGPRVQCLYDGACQAGVALPGVAAFDPVPPPPPNAEQIVAWVARRVPRQPALLRAVQVTVFRFEDYRRTLDAAAASLARGAAETAQVEDLRRKAFHLATIGASFADEPALNGLFPAPVAAPRAEGTAPLAPAGGTAPIAPPPDAGRTRAAQLAERVAAQLPGIEAVLTLIEHPSPPGLGELLSPEARARRALAVRVAADAEAIALLRAVRQAHAALAAGLSREEGTAALAAGCERLSRLVWRGRSHPLLGGLFGGRAA